MTAPVAVIPIQQLGASRDHASAQHQASADGGEEDYWRQRHAATSSTSTTRTTPPRPRPLLPAADLLFPPFFVALAGIACWKAPHAVSALLLFLTLVPCYVLGVFLVVVKLGGVSPPQSALPASRLVAASATALLCASFFSFAVWQLPLLWWIGEEGGGARRSFLPFLRFRVRAESATLLACFSLFLVVQWRLATSDPGRVGGGRATPAEAAPPRVPNHHAGTCVTCGFLRPLRSKHCGACGACVRRMDHHCPVVSNCVGERTQAEFLLFLKITATGQFLMLRLAWVAAAVAFATDGGGGGESSGGGESGGGASFLSPLAAASRRARGQLLLCVVQLPIFLSTVFLVLRGFFCAAANLTVNELAGRERYAYLRHRDDDQERRRGPAGGGGGVFVNRFDRGVVENLASFFHVDRRLSALVDRGNRSSSFDADHDHHWSDKLDAAIAEHGPAGPTPPPLGTKVVRWLDERNEERRKRTRDRRGEGEAASDVGGGGGAGAACPSLDVELAPLWGEGKGGSGERTL